MKSHKLLLLTVLIAISAIACGGNGESVPATSGPSVTATPTAVASTPTPAPEEEVVLAYRAFWEAYSSALLNLDAAEVRDFASDDELAYIEDEIEGLRNQGVAMRVVVIHNPVVLEVTGNSATLLDEMVNNSFYVDPVTKNPPIASGQGNVLRDTYYLEKQGGRWIVVGSVRHREGGP